MLDAHYTPLEIARQMIVGLPSHFSPRSVADFACGDGALLLEAMERWPSAQFVANDIDANLTRRLQRRQTDWIISSVDFLSDISLQRSKLNAYQKSVDCILINPPFSERGKARIEIEFQGTTVSAGVTMAFLLRALRFLAIRGYMVAVLPDSCFISQRDRKAWDLIKEYFSVQKMLSNSRSTFKGIAASTTVAILQRHPEKKISQAATAHRELKELNIVRGKLQMHAVRNWASMSGYPLVHTAHLSKNRVKFQGNETVDYRHVVEGPAVLVPRVGLMTRDKVAILPHGVSVVLSDCVLGIKSQSISSTELMQKILDGWEIFRGAYGGTGAPYTTLERLAAVLAVLVPQSTQSDVKQSSNTRVESPLTFGRRRQNVMAIC